MTPQLIIPWILLKSLLQDSRFKFYQNKTNKGCGYTKRKCLDLSTGEYCAFIDPDDALFSDAVECLLDELCKSSKVIAAYSKLVFCDENLNPQEIFSKIRQIHNNKYFFNIPIQIQPFFAFKRNAYMKTSGINPILKNAVDQDLYLKLLEIGDAKFVDKVSYKYRLHSNGISQHGAKQSAKESFARVIHETMRRRNITVINGNPVPVIYTNAKDIYNLLNYQTKIPYRLMNKIRMVFQ